MTSGYSRDINTESEAVATSACKEKEVATSVRGRDISSEDKMSRHHLVVATVIALKRRSRQHSIVATTIPQKRRSRQHLAVATSIAKT